MTKEINPVRLIQLLAKHIEENPELAQAPVSLIIDGIKVNAGRCFVNSGQITIMKT